MHVGVSPTSVRNLRSRMEEIIIEYQKVQEKHCKSRKPIKVAVGADETFFNDMILVFMDLASGYIFFEEEARNWLSKYSGPVSCKQRNCKTLRAESQQKVCCGTG